MTRYLLATLLSALFGVGAAHAQPAPSGLDGAYWAGACNSVTFTGTHGPRTLMVDGNGNLCVSGGGGGGGGTSSNFGAAFPATGTAMGVSDGTNMQPLTIDGSNNLNVNINAATAAITLGVGTNIVGKVGIDQTTVGTSNAVSVAYWGTHAVTVDGSGLPEISASNLFTTDEAAFTAGSSGFSTIGGFYQTTPTSNALTTGQSGVAQMTANRSLFVSLRSAGLEVGTTGSPLYTQGNALTTFFLQPTASDNHANIKNGAGTVYNVVAFNNSATVNYIRLYNAATGFNGCNSATGLVTQFQVPASTTVGGFTVNIPQGLSFSTGISICVTSGYATTDTTNATATAMSVTVGYL